MQRRFFLTILLLCLMAIVPFSHAQDTFVDVTDVVGGVYHLPLSNCPTQGLTYTRSTNAFGCVSGSSAPAAGSNTQVQFNDSGVLGGDAGFTYVKATDTASIGALVLATALPATSGGTGLASYAVGDLLYASTTTALSKLAGVATGSLLTSGGVSTAPAWSPSPTLTTSLTTPLVIGGTGTTSTLTLRSTSGSGTTGADVVLQAGTNGATEIGRFTNIGNLLLQNNLGYQINDNAATPRTLLTLSSSNSVFFGYATSAATFLVSGTNIDLYPTNTATGRLTTTGLYLGAAVSATDIFNVSGQAARIIGSARHTTANTAGNTLTLKAGGATSGATDKAGGSLILIPGVATGTGAGKVQIASALAQASTNTTDNTPVAHFQVSQGHVESLGTAPAIGGSCGTSPSIVGTDVAGKVTTGSVAPTSCTVTFAQTWANAPACMTINETTANLTKATSTTTTLTITGTFVAGDVLSYVCIGRA